MRRLSMRMPNKSSLRKISNILKQLNKDKRAVVGFSILSIYIFMATIGPEIIPLDLSAHLDKVFAPPSLENPLGTDYAGRDILAMLVHGSRNVLLTAALTGLITIALAMTLGLTSGYLGGKVDAAISALMDIFLTIPSMPLLIVITSAIRMRTANPFIISFILSIVSWPSVSRSIRAQVLPIKERAFIEAARALGLPRRHIIFREILPNVLPYIVLNYIFTLRNAIYAQVGLFFIGALPLETVNWGVMLNLALSRSGALYGIKGVYYLLAPIICISLLQVGLILLAGGLEKLLNPRLREE